ncbi:MAG: response regulator [Micrococcales bacterium]|nr:response regulator [Micrococcales bacterium]
MYDVLVVDDDFMVARAHARVIELTDGFQVTGVAHSGGQALTMLQRLSPQLVLLDIYLPDMSGLEVISRGRAAGSTADFLVLSAAREPDTVGAALQGGIVSYLIKPFKIEELRERLRTYLARRETLEGEDRLDQAALDRMLGAAPAAAGPAAPPPKGISPETAALVASVLREGAADLSAAECARLLGLSRVVARKYLEYFVETDRATVHLRYGQAGRPQRRYAWIGGN